MTPPTNSARLISSLATTNATIAHAGPVNIYTIIGYCVAASYLKVYDKAIAPVVGTDTPKLTIYLPASTAFVIDFPSSFQLSQGLAFALTDGGADADTAAIAAGDVLGLNLLYSRG